MKRFTILTLSLAAAAAVVIIWQRRAPEAVPAPIPQVVDGGTLKTSADPAEIFQRAFWKRPGTEDKILHAERREWVSDSTGVRQWQWFLMLEPPAGFIAAQLERFSLKAGSWTPGAAAMPAWFQKAVKPGTATHTSPDGALTLIAMADGRVLATGTGGGFAAPAVP